MPTYQALMNPTTQNGRTHRRNHHKELREFRSMPLEDIGAYILISHLIFQDGAPTVPAHRPDMLVEMLGRGVPNGAEIVDRLIDREMIVPLNGLLITQAQRSNFKKVTPKKRS
ncbi:hypothetical protein [uncultured Pelagimonas sp.]|uniref:hypothetical protein n=1 Tax=uncultured Pelagimonas sp. TaxID=1618102 RepID=UPI002626D053|nr:hypothetical protein [uncultured Pelagimonas sp.]